MKTLNLLTLTGTVLAAIALNVSASDALLSPRAKDSQAKTVPAVATDPNLATANRDLAVSPRLLGQQTRTAGAVETRNLAVGACAIGSPKQIEGLAKTASATCCKTTTTTCTAPKACCVANR